MPVELVHMICGYLNPVEVASIRIISGTIAAIGLEYIATTVTLSLEENSFDRLVEIAHQPVISKYVYSLHYEHDFLTRLTREEWENTIRTPEHTAALNGDSRIRAPNFDASERALRLFHRKHAVLKARNTYGNKRLDQAFLMYQRHCAEQDCTRRSGFFSNKLTHALQHLPNLRTIHMPAYGSYSRYRMEIGNLLEGAFFDQPTIKSDNVGVTPSVLLAVDQAVRGAQNMNTRATSSGHVAALSAISRNQSKAIGNDAAGSSQVSASPRGRTPDSGCSRRNDLGSSNRRILRIEDFRSESLN